MILAEGMELEFFCSFSFVVLGWRYLVPPSLSILLAWLL